MDAKKTNVPIIILGTLVAIYAVIVGYLYLKPHQELSQVPLLPSPGAAQTNPPPEIKPDKPVASSLPQVLFMQTDLPDYPNHKDGKITLSSMVVESRQKTDLLTLDACYLLPTLAPDKSKMAYLVMSNQECEQEYYTNIGDTELWIYDFQTKDRRLIAGNVWKFVAPQWSLDGRYLGYERVVDYQGAPGREQKVYFYNLESGQESLIVFVAGVSSGLVAISADNNYLYFQEPSDLLRINVQTGVQTKIFTIDYGYDAVFTILPDRQKIVVFSEEGWYGGKPTPTNWKIGAIDLSDNYYNELYSGTDQIYLLHADPFGNRPLVTSDGAQVIYGITGKNLGLWLMSLLDGTKHKIDLKLPDFSFISPIDLSLSGKYLLYGGVATQNTGSTDGSSRWHYYVMSLVDNSVQELGNFDYHNEKAIFLLD